MGTEGVKLTQAAWLANEQGERIVAVDPMFGSSGFQTGPHEGTRMRRETEAINAEFAYTSSPSSSFGAPAYCKLTVHLTPGFTSLKK